MVNNYDVAVLSEKVAYLEAAIKNAGIELPTVTEADNGKGLQVVNGAWATGSIIPAPLPTVTAGDVNEVLQVNNSGDWVSDTLGTWSDRVELKDDSGFKVFGRVNKKLKLGLLRISGKNDTPSSTTINFTISDNDFTPLDSEYFAAVRYGGSLYITEGEGIITVTLRDLNASQLWLAGYILYPLR